MDPLFVINPDETIKTVNREFVDLHGYSQQKLVGSRLNLILDGRDEEPLQNSFVNGSLDKVAKTFVAEDGSLVPLSMSALSCMISKAMWMDSSAPCEIGMTAARKRIHYKKARKDTGL